MDFADHGVAGDAAKLTCDLAGAQAFGPQLLELLNAFVRPTHIDTPSARTLVKSDP